MKCPNCAHENEETALYCENCGTQLVEKPLIPVVITLPAPAPKIEFPKVCSVCNTPNQRTSDFCENCGAKLEA